MLSAIKFPRPWLHVLLLCSFALAPVFCWAENLKVIVLLSDNSAPYLSFANVLRKKLPALMRITVLEHPEQLSPDVRTDLIVAVGMKAAQLSITQTGTPVLTVMIPKRSYEDLLAQVSSKKTTPAISAIYLNQPWNRQFDFLQAALPERRRIGLLHSPDAHIDVVQLRRDIAQRGGSLIDQPVLSTDELFPKLASVLTASDALLAIPDSTIYSSSNIRNILLTSYRNGVPLIGLSEAYVNAGALGAIFSTPEQLAEQANSVIMQFAENRRLPDSQYPVAFTIAVNMQVARSLGIAVPSAEEIRNQIEKVEGKR